MSRRCVIPRWLPFLLGGLLLPWLLWATSSLMRHEIEQQITNQRLDRLESK